MYTAGTFRAAYTPLGLTQSRGLPGSALDNAVIESWHSTVEFELRRLKHFTTWAQARARVAAWIEEYNHDRRHSALGMRSSIDRGRRGRKIDPEWTNRRRLLTGRERLTHQRFTTVWNAGDPDLRGAHPVSMPTERPDPHHLVAKDELRALLATARTGGHRHDISHRLYRFCTWCANADIPEVTRLAQTVEDWWPEIEAFCKIGISNAKTEGINRLIKDVARRACGFGNPDNQRRRVRYFCTRQSRRSTASHETMPGESKGCQSG
jgi:hypothetical protein